MKKAVYTYFAPTQEQQAAGFNSTRDLAMFLSLSVEYSRKYFKKVELVTDNAGKKLLVDKYKIRFTSVSTALEGLKVHKDLWAFAKVKTYSLQKEPFVHIDLDCILWERLPQKLLRSDIFFQNKETFDIQPGYPGIIQEAYKSTISYYLKLANAEYACNCGVVGVNNLEVVRKWYDMAVEFIYSPSNAGFWDSLANKEQMNYLFEQYFVSCVLHHEKIEPVFLVENFSYKSVEKPKIKFSHVWGENKKRPEEILRYKKRLQVDYPSIYSRLDRIKEDADQVFHGIFKKGPKKFQDRLRKVIKEHKIKSIVYLGYDGKKSSRYVDKEQEVDFLYSGGSVSVFPKCDLVVTKDMVPRWTGKEYADFASNWSKRARFVMDASGVYGK